MSLDMQITDTIDIGKVGIWMGAVGKQAIQKAAEYLAERAVLHAPEDTGWLKASITVDLAPAGSIARVTVGAFYAVFVEFGHMTPQATWVPPNPFMTRAMDDVRRQFPLVVENAVSLTPFGGEWRDTFGLKTQSDVFMGVQFTAQM